MGSILKAFIPWIIFSILLGHGDRTVSIASGAALLVHFILNKRFIKRYFIFDIGTLVFFALLLLNAFVFKNALVSNNAYLLSTVALALIAWLSLLMQKPFTSQYAALNLSVELTHSETFKKINNILTFVWAILLTLMVLPSMAYKLGWIISADFRVITNIALILVGIWITIKFPDWFISRNVRRRFNINIKTIFKEAKQPKINENIFNADQLIPNPNETTEVLIVGAGPVGLTTALLLQKHGVTTMVLEKHTGVSIHPKARHVSARSMEIFRRLGVAEQIYHHRLPKAQSWFGWFKTLVSGPNSKVISKNNYAEISPCTPASSAQPYVEKILLEKYINAGGQVLFSHQVTKIVQNESKVQLTVSNTNTHKSCVFQGKYCVAADGARSSIREAFHIPMHGQTELSANYSVFCEVNLDHLIEEKDRCSIAFVFAGDGPAPMVLSIDGKHKWIFIFPTPGIASKKAEEIFTEDYCIEKIQSVVGSKNIDVQIISRQAWSLGAQVANQFVVGRTVLAGDSIHQFTPTGGMGMNTGIGDADNLAWKLAYLLQNKVKPEILESYDTERMPVILDNLAWSIENLQRIVNIQQDLDRSNQLTQDWQRLTAAQSKHLNRSGIDLGYIYQSFIIASINTKPPIMNPNQYQPILYPGARLPHFNLLYDDKILSVLDLIKTKFLLITMAKNKDRIIQIDFGSIPTETLLLGSAKNECKIADTHFAKQGFGLDETTVIWVRPDGHITWVGSVNDLPVLKKLIKSMSIKHKSCLQ